ncbi:MAG: prepilin-type N-terminal cleavage/methylation domain-containing protein [Gammaproteobacteria bacterium]|nr:prepilin-type N-terminal cleavage/methylation domain-containing protein [Gammaproteobacteria bacterium]
MSQFRASGPNSGNRIGGFTLLEVLVAMTIMAMTIGVLMNVYSSVLDRSSLSTEYRAATNIAQTVLKEKMRSGGRLDPHMEGQYDKKFKWIIDVEPFEDGTRKQDAKALLSLYSLDVSVQWIHKRKARKIHLNTIRLLRTT